MPSRIKLSLFVQLAFGNVVLGNVGGFSRCRLVRRCLADSIYRYRGGLTRIFSHSPCKSYRHAHAVQMWVQRWIEGGGKAYLNLRLIMLPQLVVLISETIAGLEKIIRRCTVLVHSQDEPHGRLVTIRRGVNPRIVSRDTSNHAPRANGIIQTGDDVGIHLHLELLICVCYRGGVGNRMVVDRGSSGIAQEGFSEDGD